MIIDEMSARSAAGFKGFCKNECPAALTSARTSEEPSAVTMIAGMSTPQATATARMAVQPSSASRW